MLLRERLVKSAIPVHGFTLVELTVSMAIMLVVMAITLSGGPQSITRLKLAEDTYKTELLVRQVQLEGSAVNSLDGMFGGAGIFFDMSSSTEVLTFKDIVDPSIERAIGVGNGLYDVVPVSEQTTTYSLGSKNKIAKLCVATTSPSVFYCNNDNVPRVNTLTVSFSRPKQEAQIFINSTTTVRYTTACVQFETPLAPMAGYVRSLLIYESGMISKKLGACN